MGFETFSKIFNIVNGQDGSFYIKKHVLDECEFDLNFLIAAEKLDENIAELCQIKNSLWELRFDCTDRDGHYEYFGHDFFYVMKRFLKDLEEYYA